MEKYISPLALDMEKQFYFNFYIIRERTNQEVIFHRLLCCSPRVSNFYAQRNKGTAHLEKEHQRRACPVSHV